MVYFVNTEYMTKMIINWNVASFSPCLKVIVVQSIAYEKLV